MGLGWEGGIEAVTAMERSHPLNLILSSAWLIGGFAGMSLLPSGSLEMVAAGRGGWCEGPSEPRGGRGVSCFAVALDAVFWRDWKVGLAVITLLLRLFSSSELVRSTITLPAPFIFRPGFDDGPRIACWSMGLSSLGFALLLMWHKFRFFGLYQGLDFLRGRDVFCPTRWA